VEMVVVVVVDELDTRKSFGLRDLQNTTEV
jgi:hypothetical protein